jgi:hypothetical protein
MLRARTRRVSLCSAVAAAVVVCGAAQTPVDRGKSPENNAQRVYPAPTNLRVLPKEMTGQQVHDLMEQWRVELGVRCSACHGEDEDNVVPAGPRRSRFPDDSQPMKGVARLMYTMTEQINRDFISKVEGSGLPVTCGTCHRGRVSPEPAFVAPTVQLSGDQFPQP